MPSSGVLFAQSVIFLMLVTTLIVGGVVRVLGRPASTVMLPLAIVFALACPFLMAWHPADAPNYGDALLGWPLSYAYAQSDAGLTSFRWPPLLADFVLGTLLGLTYVFFRRRHANHRNA